MRLSTFCGLRLDQEQYGTNILQDLKLAEGETIEILCLFPRVESQHFGPVITFSVDTGHRLHFTFILDF
jgi:hypothetical protein